MTDSRAGEGWPTLLVDDWEPTRRSLHMWSQIVGKVRMEHAPLLNHWWQVPLYVSPRGLTTSTIPVGTGAFDMEFDFVDHALKMRVSDGRTAGIDLHDLSVAGFYHAVLDTLGGLGIPARISAGPNEVHPAIPFAEDTHTGYDPAAANAFWRQLIQADRVIGRFRSHFIGKVSPVHFFWGSFDLACTRFSGRGAPRHPGGVPNCGDWVMEEGYSHELSSCGFWPGGAAEGAFYSYAYPEPAGFADAAGIPDGAFYDAGLRQYLLPYETARQAKDPDATVMRFLEFTYSAAADLMNWDRHALESNPDRWTHKASSR
ncbi:DUF5996 family protein [Mycolicibacterium iranicum]|uniref:DUF5996 family protein n=1 Tax=Mycolicibacterium iranicum TaxID=912594 RepID=A0A1X1WSG3_MYCIR|nr:DUF5996 family protein [Mycolicibacterium iranicum]MCZ0727309.1 DUF5996 family protein [Mycolicibacterium iranicum]ORV89541.1 hypothetical protein AWC12_08950 [Mycolicibacterium iranicum]